MNTLENIDIVVERERDAAVDALCDSQPFQLVDEPFVYNKDSWNDDVDAMIVSVHPDLNDALRIAIRDAIWWLNAQDSRSDLGQLRDAASLARAAADVGNLIIRNAIDNGLTYEKLGERT